MQAVAFNTPPANTAAGSHNTFPLCAAPRGVALVIRKCRGKDDTMCHLSDIGFVPGSCVRVITENSGNLILDVKGARVGLSRQMAQRIMVAEA